MKNIIYTLIAIFTLTITNAQVGIGTNTPDAASILDVVSTNKGVLLPRVNLTSSTMDLDGNTTQPTSLMVYNTGTTLRQGYYWWNGTEWVSVDNSPSSPPTMETLSCNSAYLTPATYLAGTAFSGYLKVPYDGGNGSNYNGGLTIASTGVTGLTAKLLSGKLAYGSGDLVFKVTGTPSGSSPQSATFNLSGLKVAGSEIIGGTYTTCSATVGDKDAADIKTTAVMQFMYPVTAASSGAADGYHVYATTPDGKFSIRAFLLHTGGPFPTGNTAQVQLTDVQIRSNGITRTIMWNHLGGYGAATTTQSGNSLLCAADRWGGDQNGGVTFTAQAANATRVFLADAGIYQAANSGPEFRYYSWISQELTDKTAYLATIMGGATSGNTATNYTTMKVYIKIEQINAP